VDLRQMEVVIAVAEEGGFTAAAQRLHIVQSAVSSTVRALERELGTPLFDRTTHRVSLTPAGEAFVPAARAAIRATEQARAAVDVVQGHLRGRITVGAMQGVWAELHRPPAALRAEHPGVVEGKRLAVRDDPPVPPSRAELEGHGGPAPGRGTPGGRRAAAAHDLTEAGSRDGSAGPGSLTAPGQHLLQR
jgi:DNA-binding transcriptional LysR family regulator